MSTPDSDHAAADGNVAAGPWTGRADTGPERNSGIALDQGWVRSVRVNRSAVERRAATLTARRSIKKNWQAAWLLKAVSAIDLTTLAGDDTPAKVHRLCAKARQPVRADLLDALGMGGQPLKVAAVCVYHAMLPAAIAALDGSQIPLAAVSAGFPAGLAPRETRVREIEASVAAGASEIDIVINRGHVLAGNWRELYDEVRGFREACGAAHLKAIIAAGDLSTLRNVGRASLVCMMAGSDFIKTSTGKETVNATLPISLVMVRAIRDYHERTGHRVGFKAAGGVGTAKAALGYQTLMKDELGRDWLEPELFRIGASSLLGDIERQLEHHVSGRYSAFNRHPTA